MIIYETILKALEKCDFNELNCNNCYENVVSIVNDDISLQDNWAAGASKLVLIPPDLDFVIKIPFMGEVGAEGFIPFAGAEDLKEGWDYCKAEQLKYLEAKEAGLKYLFAETKKIGEVYGYPIYAQPKMEIFFDVKDDTDYEEYSYERTSNTEDICFSLGVSCFHKCWLSDFLDYFSEETLKRLNKFLFDKRIHDLHGGNLGYNLRTGVPIIVDYSDFSS